MKEFILFLWDRFIRRCRNVGYGECLWNHEGQAARRILLDERMCHDCYFNDYVLRYK